MPVICRRAGCVDEREAVLTRLRSDADRGPRLDERRQILNRFIRRGQSVLEEAGIDYPDSATCQYCGEVVADGLSGTFHMAMCEASPEGKTGEIWAKGIGEIQSPMPKLACDGGRLREEAGGGDR